MRENKTILDTIFFFFLSFSKANKNYYILLQDYKDDDKVTWKTTYYSRHKKAMLSLRPPKKLLYVASLRRL